MTILRSSGTWPTVKKTVRNMSTAHHNKLNVLMDQIKQWSDGLGDEDVDSEDTTDEEQTFLPQSQDDFENVKESAMFTESVELDVDELLDVPLQQVMSNIQQQMNQLREPAVKIRSGSGSIDRVTLSLVDKDEQPIDNSEVELSEFDGMTADEFIEKISDLIDQATDQGMLVTNDNTNDFVIELVDMGGDSLEQDELQDDTLDDDTLDQVTESFINRVLRKTR
jgi:hypothetical protein